MTIPSAAAFVIGRQDRIEDVDDNACRLLGYTRSELLRLHGPDLIPSQDRPRVAVSLDRMRLGGLTERIGRLMRKDGSVVDVAVSAGARPDGALVLTVCPLPEGRR